MAQQRDDYAAMLVELETRRAELAASIAALDGDIEKVRTLLRQTVPPVPSSMPFSFNPRKNSRLNVYVNPNPEWTRQMERHHSPLRKKSVLRCPDCGSMDTRKSNSRGLFHFVVLLLDFNFARCRNCNGRFRVRNARVSDRRGNNDTAYRKNA